MATADQDVTGAAQGLNTLARLKMTIRGAVQGVGFRPFIYRLAVELELNGWVNNTALGVLVEVEGPREKLDGFLLRVERENPPSLSFKVWKAALPTWRAMSDSRFAKAKVEKKQRW